MNFSLIEPSALSSSTLSTSALIDKMFEDVLQHADEQDEDGEKEAENSNSSEPEKEDETEPDMDKSNPASQEHSEMCEEKEETLDGSFAVDEEQELQSDDRSDEEMEQKMDNASMGAEEDFLTLPPKCILSPLSKSVEAVVTPMVLF